MSIFYAFLIAVVFVALIVGTLRSRRSAAKTSAADEISINEVALNREMDDFIRRLNADQAA